MTRIRPKRQRSAGFEALEGRLALSAGTAAAPHHIHSAIVRTSQPTISASFQGRTTITGSTLTIKNLTGKIKNDRLTGSGSGTQVGNVFQGGSVTLSNKHGSVELVLESVQTVTVGKKSRKVIPLVIEAASGKYAPFQGDMGVITRWNDPAKPNAVARFSGVLIL
jgi:hypothetical protein